MLKSSGKLFAFVFSLLLFVQVVSALALVPGGYYPRYCPVVVQDSAGSSFRVYTASGGFTGLSGTVSSTGYGAFQMTSAFPYNNYIVRVNGVSKTFQLKSGASCTLCFLNNTPFTDGQVNPSNSNQYCDVSDPWSWQTREAARVVITPGSVSTPLVYGQSISFTAVAYDEDGAVVRYPVEWDVDGDAVELVSYSGDSTGASATFTAEHAGNSYVVARVEGVESRVRLRVLYGALDEIELRLSPVDSYVRSGESVRVIASGFDEDGNAVPVSPSWSLVGDSHVGRLSSSGANASFRGLKVGSVNVSASSGSVSARVRLDVIPGNVSSIVVLRGGEDVDGFFEAEAGSDSALAVQAFDASNNLIDESDLSFVWGALIGSFDDASESEVVFTARESIGSGNLSVRVRGERGESVSENVLVRVYPAALDGIRVSPGGEVSIVSGSLKNFSVVGFDEFGNSIGLRGNPAWSASPSELGRFTGSGMNVTFRGGAAVDGEIAVSYGEFSDSVDVSVSPSGVDSVELFVGNVSANSLLTVQAGGSVGFVAVARDAFGNDVSDDASFSWSVSPSALGSVDADDASASFEAREVLLANNSGSVRVVVFSGGKNKTDSVNVQLVAGPVDEVRVSPESAEVRSGESSNFTVSGSDEFGNLVNVSGARWSVSGLGSYSEFVGSVYSFVASRVGTGRVTATVGSLSDYADVEVSSGRLASIRVSSNNLTVPASFSVGAGSEKNFEVQAFDASGNEIFDGLVFLWRSNVGSFDDAGESENVFAVQERAPASGVVNVSVRDGAISRNASFSVSVSPGVVASVELSPDSVDEIVLGSNESFSVRAFDEFDNLLSGVVFAWSSNGGSFNSSSGSSVLFTASSVGVVNVSVSSGGVFGFVSFEVVRRVSEIEIVLNNEVVDSEVPVIAGESVDFDAVGFDDSGNEVELSGVVWSVESGVGVVDGDGVFSSTVAGASVVSARAEGFSDNASLFVYGSDLSAVEVYRNSELVGASEVVPVGAGSEENFSVRAFDEFGNVLSEDVSISWSSNVGEFDDENAGEVVFTAREEAGVGTISVSVQGDEGNVVQRELNVSIVPSVLDVVEIYSGGELVEDIVLLASGESVVFVARGFDVFENEVQLVRGDWSVEGGRGFVESSSVVNETGQFFVGTYTGGEIGVASVNFTGTAGGYVVGSQVSASDGVEVEVSAGAPANLSLSASYYTYPYSGDDIFVVARLSDEFGNPVSGEEVSFDLVSSPEPAGLLSDLSVVTNESGDALVVLTASSSPAGGLHVVEASVGGLSANYSVNVSSLFVSISGTVYGGGPLEGAAVEVYSFDSSELVDSAVTNSSGSFEFSELLNGSYYLVVGAEGYLDFTSEEILLYPGGSTSIPIQLVSEDSVAPVIEFVSPTLENASGASGIITVNVSVTDDVETNTIVVYANGVEVGGHFSTGQNSSGTTLDLDTVNYMEGDLEVVVFANDSSGNGVFVSRVFFVDNVAPVVEFVSPTPDAGAVVNGSFEVAVNGSDETSLCAWVFVNGSEVGGQCDNSTTGDGNVVFVASEVDSTRYPDGELVVSVLASGLASTIEISRTFVVNNSVPSVPAEIIVSSNASEMLAGESIQFNAVVLDESGNEIEGAVVAWSASGGTIDVVGVFSSNVSGEFVVSAFVGSVVGNASVSVLASAPASVVVSLSNASIVAGESVDFDAVVSDAFGNVVSNETIVWSSSGGVVDVGTGVFSSNVSGEFVVFAVVGSVSGNASVSVSPSVLDRVDIYRGGAVVEELIDVPAGSSTRFEARGFDAFGNEVELIDAEWRAENVGVVSGEVVVDEFGVVSSYGVFNASESVSVGNVSVVGTAGGYVVGSQVNASDVLGVRVVPADVASVVVSLDAVSVVVSEFVDFDAVAFDSFGNVVSDAVVVWSSSGGFVDVDGVFSSNVVGEFVVFASVGGVSGNASVSVLPSSVSSVVVSPNVATVVAGESIDFNASVFDAGGSLLENASVSWSASGGTIDVVGVFSSNVSGEYLVVAVVGGVSGNASVSVVAGAPAGLSSSASVENVLPGVESVVNVVLTDEFGNVIEGVEVLFALLDSPSPSGLLSASSAITNSSGEASVVLTASLNRSGGLHLVNASVGELSATSLVYSNATVGSLGGTVSSNGSVVEGAFVEVNGAGLNATTNSSGNYYFAEVEPGVYSVYAVLAGFVSQVVNDVSVAAGLPSIVNFELAEFGSVNGFAVDSYGNAVEGVLVSVEGFEVSTVSLADGGYSLSLAPGVYNLSFSKAGFEGARVENVVVLSGESAQADVVLREFGGIGGIVVDAMTDVSIEGVTVTVFEAGTSNVVVQTVSGVDGGYSFVLPAGVYDVQADSSTASVDYGVQVVYGQVVAPGESVSLIFPFL